MGHYRNGNYYRGKNDAELQWLEDGAGLLGGMVFYGVCALFTGLFGLIIALFQLIFPGDKT